RCHAQSKPSAKIDSTPVPTCSATGTTVSGAPADAKQIDPACFPAASVPAVNVAARVAPPSPGTLPASGDAASQATGVAAVPQGSEASSSSSITRCTHSNAMSGSETGSWTPHSGAIQYAGAVSPSLFPPG